MLKLLVLLLPLVACSKSEPNLAEVMVKAQQPKATCKVAKAGSLDVAVCDIPGKDKIVQFVAVYGKDVTFKAWPLADEAPKAPVQPTPDAGVDAK